ncbi:MAG: hypothetical protein H6719_14895 [Sandaracinaceae bacterium]|nr:hypothetical protein [Sandaracinaceae bacterium]
MSAFRKVVLCLSIVAGAVGCEDGRGRDAGLADAGLADAGVDRTYDYCATSTECSMEQTCFEIRTSATAGAACARECSSDAVCERNNGFPGACLNVDGLGGICFQQCEVASDCVSSSSCFDFTDADGFTDRVCLPERL